eukprot:5137472-Karenia_brevis.AAC.1
MPYIKFVNDEAPFDIDTYSDGTLTLPKTPQYALSGAGVWGPGRATPVQDSESTFAHVDTSSKGVTLCGAFAGLPISSYKAEIVGLNLSLWSNAPVHTGLDNK